MADITIRANPYILGQLQSGLGGGVGGTVRGQLDGIDKFKIGEEYNLSPFIDFGVQGLWSGVTKSEDVVVMGCPDDSASLMTGDCEEITEKQTTTQTQVKPQLVVGAGVMTNIEGSDLQGGASLGARGKNFAVTPQLEWKLSESVGVSAALPILLGGKDGLGFGVTGGLTFKFGKIELHESPLQRQQKIDYEK